MKAYDRYEGIKYYFNVDYMFDEEYCFNKFKSLKTETIENILNLSCKLFWLSVFNV